MTAYHPLHLGVLRRIQQALFVGLAAARLADQPLRAPGGKALGAVDHPGPAQPDLLGDLSIGQAALAKPDYLPPALFLSRRGQLAHVHVPHARELGTPVNQIKTMRAASIRWSAKAERDLRVARRLLPITAALDGMSREAAVHGLERTGRRCGTG